MTPIDLDAARLELRSDEGVRLKVYTDGKGIPTIGVGRNLRDRGISPAVCDALLDEDIAECLADLRSFPWFASLDPVRQRAVLNLRFNLGAGTFRTFRKFITAMEQKDYATAAAELMNSQWAQQVQPSRRDRIVAQVRDGLG